MEVREEGRNEVRWCQTRLLKWACVCLCSVYPRKSRERVCDRQELVGEERKERGEERKTAEIIAGLLFLGVSAEMAALHPAAGGVGGGGETSCFTFGWCGHGNKTRESTCAAGSVRLPVLYPGDRGAPCCMRLLDKIRHKVQCESQPALHSRFPIMTQVYADRIKDKRFRCNSI